MDTYTIPENVNAFLAKASKCYGRYKDEEFNQYLWRECLEIKSPIEQLFLVGLHLVSEINLVSPRIVTEFSDLTDDFLIVSQWSLGKYRADFAIRQHPIDKIVCVELDGHEFHDRDEKQRRYEKTRDRFFTAHGYGVLHFTGSEVVKDPCAAALEAFNLATRLREVAVHPFEED